VKLRGWDVVRLSDGDIEVDIVPEKGGDIIAVRYRGENLLWESPWGLKPRGEAVKGATSSERWLEMYPGGWQTVFPNGGDEVDQYGFHGDACLVPYDVEQEHDGIVLSGTSATVPAAISRKIHVEGNAVHVSETITNRSSSTFEAMWSHHPAFGLPLIAGARIECGATTFVVDDARDTPASDLVLGAVSEWPRAPLRSGGVADPRELPPVGTVRDRFGYCTGFTEGWATITDDSMQVRLEWDATVFPCAWYWLEARATMGYPWFGEAHVFAIEPASSWPGQGIANARAKGNGPLTWEPGESKTARVTLSVAER
jgi:galactose mutarotase-like enzyme